MCAAKTKHGGVREGVFRERSDCSVIHHLPRISQSITSFPALRSLLSRVYRFTGFFFPLIPPLPSLAFSTLLRKLRGVVAIFVFSRLCFTRMFVCCVSSSSKFRGKYCPLFPVFFFFFFSFSATTVNLARSETPSSPLFSPFPLFLSSATLVRGKQSGDLGKRSAGVPAGSDDSPRRVLLTLSVCLSVHLFLSLSLASDRRPSRKGTYRRTAREGTLGKKVSESGLH